MTLQQEAYNAIDRMSDDSVRVLLDFIKGLQTVSVPTLGRVDADINNAETVDRTESDSDIVDTINVSDLQAMSKEEKRELFLQSAGRMRVDANAIYDLRERNMI